ncbi:hypothetical protein P5E90_12200 [Clostridium perfringens]|nr:hypothetical protein [Clostridium perfringens]
MIKLIEEKHLDYNNTDVKRFECLGYEIEEVTYSDGNINVNVNLMDYKNHYKPNIYVDIDIMDFNIKGVKIQTTSYGGKNIEDIKKIIKEYEKAIDVATILEKRYLNKNK